LALLVRSLLLFLRRSPQLLSGTRMPIRKSRLLSLNDARLSAYLSASDDASRNEELERLLIEEVQPRVDELLETYIRADWPIDPDDRQDIRAQVTLRLLRKLRASTVLEEESIQNIEAYVVTLTRNAVRDLMRRRSPRRTRMKSRMRYLFQHDARLALWNINNVILCGLAGWRDQPSHEADVTRLRALLQESMRGSEPTVQGIVSALTSIGKPLRLADLVTTLLPEQGEVQERLSELSTPSQFLTDPVEARQYLQVLWREIRDLPPRQQSALLLNLREPGSGNAVILFLAVSIATFEEIATALGMTADELTAIWDDLPFDDLKIAELLGITRQQVINLRKSARERLTRRMTTHGAGRQ